jgi:RNA-directed DNA polymerase
MAERAAECPLRDKLESEGGNRSGRMSHERSNGSRGGPYRIGSVSKEAEELPAGNSAVESARDGRHAPPLNSSPGAESPPVGVPIDSSSTPVVISPGPATMERQKEVNKRKAHSLIDKVYGRKNLWTAWRRVRANKGAHGLDRVTIHAFEADVRTHLEEIQRKLMEHRYEPQPVRRVYIPKSSDPKQRRPLGIPVVADRIVGQALLQILDPLFDPEMSDRSFGFRKGRKAHQAISTVIQDGKDGFRFVLDADIASFFDRIDHQVVMSRVRARIADGRVLDLIEAFLKAGVCEAGVVSVPTEGTPQGGVISPWLSNLVLDDLDKAIEAKGWRHVRYADDFVVLCTTHQEAQEALAYIKEVLAALKLSLHETKTRLTDFWAGFEFLGFRFRCHRLGIRPKSIERFKDKLRTLTRRLQGRNVEAVIAEVSPVVRGWAQYFGCAEVGSLFRTLDCWIRMRVRSFRFKRRCREDNHRLPNRRLSKWGLLSLQECRPVLRLSYMAAET